jgi:putative oxidoreductase
MKKILTTVHNPGSADIALLIARVTIAGFMLVHGIPKMERLVSNEPIAFASVFGMGQELSLGLAVFAEVICSVLVLLGLGTRLAVIPLIITMTIAVFSIHGADPFVKKEMGLHYLLTYVMLLLMGSGRYSLDHYLFVNPKRNYKPILS